MNSIISTLAQGSAHIWLFLPSAILLGALHGLEPGHSKTMMAAFIIAIRGTIFQACLLGLSAAFSHTLLIWLLAALALYLGQQWNVESTEPYLQVGSGIIILLTSAWMTWKTWRDINAAAAHEHRHDHAHHHDHDHSHEEDGHSHLHAESVKEDLGVYQDAHEKAHARDIESRFSGGKVSNGQVVLFGLSGGLVPCPAAFSILLLCLQLKKFAIGFALVLCFSVGLALTLVTVGVVAAWGIHHATRRLPGLSNWARRAPYFSSALLALIGVYLLASGTHTLILK